MTDVEFLKDGVARQTPSVVPASHRLLATALFRNQAWSLDVAVMGRTCSMPIEYGPKGHRTINILCICMFIPSCSGGSHAESSDSLTASSRTSDFLT